MMRQSVPSFSTLTRLRALVFSVGFLLAAQVLLAQQLENSGSSPSAATPANEELVVLSPFIVNADEETGYAATSTLAGTRLRTNLEDVGSSITVLTKEFIQDIGGTSAESILGYAPNMEVSGTGGNYLGAGDGSFGNNSEINQFLNPSGGTRVRGLVSADNTRNYFRTTVGWDTFNVGRIDVLRGPNSILFGLGSPGGVVNATTDSANLHRNSGEVELATDQFGSFRGTLSYNMVLVKDVLAIHAALLSDQRDYRQDPAFENKERQYVTGTFKPPVLNRPGTTFAISVDYENGTSKSNRPRFAPPIDSFTPYVEPRTVQDIQLPKGSNFNGYPGGIIPGGSLYLPGYQVTYAQNFSGSLPDGVGTSFDANGIRYIVDGSGSIAPLWTIGRGGAYGVYNANGSINTNPFSAALFGANYTSKLITTDLGFPHPFSSAFSPTSLTDASVFDFYNKLIDGPNKREWSDYDQMRFVLSNTFLNHNIGYEISHSRETSEFGQTTLLSDNNRILIDINQFTLDGQPNPNVGRAYVQETTFAGNRIRKSDLEGTRISGFLDYDFQKEGVGPGWLARILGRQVLNAVWSEDETNVFDRGFQRTVYPDDLLVAVGRPGVRFNNNTRTGIQYYISDDLTGVNSLSGANFSALTFPILDNMGKEPITVRVFDPTWIADASVATNAPWVNPLGANSTQSANPANYAGWTDKSYQLIDALSGNPSDLDLATSTGILDYNKVESKILSWQGYLLDGAVVATIGWREDESKSIQTVADRVGRDDGGKNVDPSVFNLANGTGYELKSRSENYSVVAHLSRLPYLGRLPINVSLSYNQGENFDPTAGRVNKLGLPLLPPQGSTEEYAVLLSSKDRRYVLKVARYETSVRNATTGAVDGELRLQQLLGNIGAVSAFEAATGILRDEYEALTTPPDWSIDDQENISVPAWYAMETALKERFPSFVDSWLVNGGGASFAPSNESTTFAIHGVNTADTVSKGYEIEFTANPTKQLRIALNASKTTAVSDHAPGAATRAIYEFIDSALWDGDTLTAAGALRNTNNPFDTQGTMGEFWRNGAWPGYQLVQQQNGQRTTELVEWRVNVIANYTFNEGRLKGFGVGGAYRWESGKSVGYPYYFDEFAQVVADVAHPFEGPANARADLTLSYGREVGKTINWRIQLNLFNAFGSNKVVPVGTNPDGTYSLYRIQEGRSWRLSTTFSF